MPQLQPHLPGAVDSEKGICGPDSRQTTTSLRISHLEVPVSGHPVTTKRSDDGDEMLTRLFSYMHEITEHGSKLMILRWLQRMRHPGELRNELC